MVVVVVVVVAVAVFELVACPMMIDQLLYWHNTLSNLVLGISPNFLVVGIVRHLAG